MNIKQLILDGTLSLVRKDKEYLREIFFGVQTAIFPTSGRYIELYINPDDFKRISISEYNKEPEVVTQYVTDIPCVNYNESNNIICGPFDNKDISVYYDKHSNQVIAVLPKQYTIDKEFHDKKFIETHLTPTDYINGKPSSYFYISDKQLKESINGYKNVCVEEILNNAEDYIE